MRKLLLNCLSLAGKEFRRTPLSRSRMLGRFQAWAAVCLHGARPAAVGPFCVHYDPMDHTVAKRLILYGGYEW